MAPQTVAPKKFFWEERSYKNMKQIEWRHKRGISKKYKHEFLHNVAESRKRWKQSPAGKLSQKKHNLIHRTRTRDLSIATIQMVYEDNIKKYGTLTCYLCLYPIEFRKDNLEHKVPLTRGGTNNYDNLAVACKSCNCKKHAKTEEEYRKEMHT